MRWLAFALVLGCASPAAASSLRCGSRLVGVGDTALELKARCGAPNRIQRRMVTVGGAVTPAASGAPVASRYTKEEVQTWLYAGAPGSLARVVTVKRGKVTAIETLSPLAVSEDDACARSLHGRGTRAVVVRHACGEPSDISRWEDSQTLSDAEGRVVGLRTFQYERWVYNPGPGRFLRVLEFRDGRLRSVKTGGRSPTP